MNESEEILGFDRESLAYEMLRNDRKGCQEIWHERFNDMAIENTVADVYWFTKNWTSTLVLTAAKNNMLW